MVGKPCIAALILAADSIAKQETLVGRSLLLHTFVVQKKTAVAARCRRVRGHAFHAHVQVGENREVRKIQAGANAGTARRTYRIDIVDRAVGN